MRVPGDKSITHRALILATLAEGRSRIRGALTGEDCRSTASVLRALGGNVPELTSGAMEVEGIGLHGLRSPEVELDCGNSGTTVRLLMGVVAGAGVSATFTGDASLRGRPMRRVTEPLQRMGARALELGESGRLPIRIEGAALRALDFESAQASAQVKSALLLAGLLGNVPVSVTEPLHSRDHTERMLKAQGVVIEERTDSAGRHGVALVPSTALLPLDLQVPGDFSSAAFILAAALLGVFPEVCVRDVGINPTRTGLLDVWRDMGASIDVENVRDQAGEPVADLVARPSALRGVRVAPERIPRMIDEVPILAAVAARAEGETEIRGASELRVKESDRIRGMVENLRSVSVAAEELTDGLIVQGSDRPLKGAVTTRLDHRIAMVFGVLAAQKGNDITLDDPDIVAVSYPDFWNALQSGTAR
jgi:3-phosphoshikimate 1-carboxyvinyltransferase